MFEKFSKYLVNKLSCLCQAANDDSSSDEHSERNSDGSPNSSQWDDESYQEDSFKSYSEEESCGEDVVESTGRSGTRNLNYEESSSKNTGSTHTIGNTEVPSLIEQHKKKKNTSIENTKKSVKLRVEKSSPRTKQEVQQKSPELKKKNSPKQKSKEFSKNSPKRERSKRDRNLKKLQTVNGNNVKQKDDKKLNTTKQDKKTTDEKVPRIRKSSLKVKENEKNVKPNRENKTRERIAKEKKDAKKTEEKRNTEEKEKGKISKAVRGTNPKITPNNQKKSTSSILPKKMSSKKTESASQMRKPTKNNSSKIGTFSKGANNSSSRRSLPTFTSKSIQKRRPMK